jgi:hypothetical protein
LELLSAMSKAKQLSSSSSTSTAIIKPGESYVNIPVVLNLSSDEYNSYKVRE